MRSVWCAGAALVLLSACGGMARSADQSASGQPASGATTTAEAPREPLTIVSRNGTHRFRVEVARTPEEQARGLMFRTALPKDGGMIFPFPVPRPASFWMKNTPLPLDLIFIRTDGTIASIAPNAVPYSEDFVTSGGEVVGAVLELEGGKTDALGIAVGDKVQWANAAK